MQPTVRLGCMRPGQPRRSSPQPTNPTHKSQLSRSGPQTQSSGWKWQVDGGQRGSLRFRFGSIRIAASKPAPLWLSTESWMNSSGPSPSTTSRATQSQTVISPCRYDRFSMFPCQTRRQPRVFVPPPRGRWPSCWDWNTTREVLLTEHRWNNACDESWRKHRVVGSVCATGDGTSVLDANAIMVTEVPAAIPSRPPYAHLAFIPTSRGRIVRQGAALLLVASCAVENGFPHYGLDCG